MNINYSILPEHMQDGMRRWIEHGIPAGSFMMSVLCNDLIGALGRADSINIERLRSYGTFLYSEAPSECHGSPEKVAAWEKRGGLRGHDKDQQAA